MAQTKIKDENELSRAAKKAHQKVQGLSRKIKETKKEIALLRKEIDEKFPDNIAAEDRKIYESIMSNVRSLIDQQAKMHLRQAEEVITESHRELNNLF